MLKIQKHIAFILLAVFSMPVVYQQVHILCHHQKDNTHYCYHEYCETENNTNHEESLEFSCSKDMQEHACAICAYKFAVNQLPESFQIQVCSNAYPEFKRFSPTNCYIQLFIEKNKSRAPPFHFTQI